MIRPARRTSPVTAANKVVTARRLTLAPAPDRRAELAADGAMGVPVAVAFLGVSRAEVYVLMGRGELPFVKLGRRRLVPKRALVDLLAANMTAD